MHHQVHASKATLGFKRPMDVVEASGIPDSEKLSILRDWEADERALQRAEDEGMVGGEHAHLHRVQEAVARLESLRGASLGKSGEPTMKWVTREKVKVDRVACPWLIRKFIDPQAEFLFVPADQVMDVAKREGATPYDVKGVEFGHHGKECSFDALVKKHGLARDPAIVLLAKIVNGADTDNSLWNQPEAAGLNAIAEGFRHLGFKDDHEMIASEAIVYDALYGYCQEMVRRGNPDGQFR
jgi:hypothetical protein